MLDEYNHDEPQNERDVQAALFEYRLLHQDDLRSIEDLLKDYRAHPEQGDQHPFVVALYNLTLKTSWAFTSKKGFATQGSDLFEAVWMDLLKAAQQAGGRLLAGHDLGQRSVVSYLWHLEKLRWIELVDRQLDEEAELRAGQSRDLTKQQARMDLDNQWVLHKKDPVHHARPVFGGRVQSLDDLALEPAGSATPIHRMAGDRWALAAASGAQPVPPSVNPGSYQTPLQSPLRVRGLANAFDELGQAMQGLKSKGKLIGKHEIQAWNAFWAATPGFDAYADVAVEELANRLGYDTKSKFLTVLGRTIDLWLYPPEDNPEDCSTLRNQKAQVRELSDHCLRLAMPSRLIGTASQRDVQNYIVQARALLQGKKADLGFQPLQQFRSSIQRDISEHLLSDASSARDTLGSNDS